MNLTIDRASSVAIWHATRNQQKVEAVNEVLATLFPKHCYRVDSRCQSVKLQEDQISSQPLGDDETKLGSLIRAREVSVNGEADINVRVGVEGGLIRQGERNLADVTYVTLLVGEREFVGRSDPLQVRDPRDQDSLYALSEAVMKCIDGLDVLQQKNVIRFGHAEGEAALDREGPQVDAYRQEIVEPLLFERKIDLYAYYSHDKLSRAAVVAQATQRAVQAFLKSEATSDSSTPLVDKLRLAQTVLEEVSELGGPASLGVRYRDMIWMRDLSIMSEALLRVGHSDTLLNALRGFIQRQNLSHEMMHDGYRRQWSFGKLPIVYLHPDRKDTGTTCAKSVSTSPPKEIHLFIREKYDSFKSPFERSKSTRVHFQQYRVAYSV